MLNKKKQTINSLLFVSDLDWIQTSNLLSRNQVRYSVAPRGQFLWVQIYFFLQETQKKIV